MSGIHYRLFNQYAENLELLFKLFENIYGDSRSVQQRWPWEFLAHPEKSGVKIFVAEDCGSLCGMTVRMPCSLRIDGRIILAHFATNSMVLSEYRGRGVIRGLYDLAAQNGDIQLSKGTAPEMCKVLGKMDYREIVPNNYQTCLLAPFKWAFSKVSGRCLFKTRESFGDLQRGDFFRLVRFDGEHGLAVARLLADRTHGGVVKDLCALNWRYCDIPHRRYHIFVRKCNGAALSMFVLRLTGQSAYLVDICWSDQAADEPAETIKFAKRLAKDMGAMKLVFWGTLQTLRNQMAKQAFWERRETPQFNYFSADPTFAQVNWSDVHFVHGDGDVDYL